MQKVTMPRLDMNMERGTVSKWLKGEGDQVEKGEPLVEIMSEKVTYEFPSPASGRLYRIMTPNEKEVPIGQVIGVIMNPEDDPLAVDKAIFDIEQNLGRLSPTNEKVEESAALNLPEKEQAKISPAARVVVNEYGIDVSKIKGSGPGGRIVKDDVLRSVGKLKTDESNVITLIGIRKVTAERMAYSFQNIPHSFLLTEVDMSIARKIRSDFEKTAEGRMSYNAIFIKAVAKALKEHPIFNSTYENGQIIMLPNINIGLAVSTEKGLIVPVINDADKKSLKELNEIVEDLVSKALRNELSMEEVKGGTFTVSNVGMFEIDVAIAIINPKQAAILTVGRVEDRARVVEGKIVVRPSATFCLSFDHRIADGVPAAQFLRRTKQIVENPSFV